MTYSLINKCAKNYYNRTFIVPVIAKNVVTCFFLRHSVVLGCCRPTPHEAYVSLTGAWEAGRPTTLAGVH